jgi:hypothetical protein
LVTRRGPDRSQSPNFKNHAHEAQTLARAQSRAGSWIVLEVGVFGMVAEEIEVSSGLLLRSRL